MDDMVKVIWTDGEAAVPLPAEFRFDTDHLRISREGDRVVLEAAEAREDGDIDDDAIDEETGLTVGRLRALIQEGLDSGDAGSLDMEEIKREGRFRMQANRKG